MAQINKPSEYFNTKLWNGNSSTQAITGVGFQPDFVWLKQRTGTQRHQLLDAIRGPNNILISDGTDAAAQDTDILNSFDSDGYTLGYQDQSNDTGFTYVGWNWKANGSGVSNTDGSITSTVSANTTSGFSIVKWTGTGSDGTIGHGLGVAPKMVIVKSLANATAWMVYHASLGNAQEIYLNSTSASGASTAWNSTTPTSTFISLDGGAGNGVNASGDYIAYCFAEKKGFSKFGSYVGNGSTDGVFCYTGMKPSFLLVKTYSTAGGWQIYDSKRNTANPTSKFLVASSGAVEASGSNDIDFLSNGFKTRTTANPGTTDSFIYMAFAENPLVGTNGVPACAR